jgi:hypothetical protein
VRPNPYLAVTLGGLDLHFCGIDGFSPEVSYGSNIALVNPANHPGTAQTGSSGGFTVVDPGGNWIRVTTDREESGSTGELVHSPATLARDSPGAP